jgi:hypothetical protein
MSEVLARFRDLKGIGPATEARLHEAGIYTWEALGAAASALAAVRDGESTKEVAALVAAHGAEAGNPQAPHAPGGERLEAFVLRLAVTGDGDVRRCRLSHVRTMDEHSSAACDPESLARFVQQHAGLRDDTVADLPAGTGRVEEPVRAGLPAPASPSRDHLVVLDAGKAIGGADRAIALRVDGLGAVARGTGYRAELYTRPLGDDRAGHGPDGGWTAAARRSGRIGPGTQQDVGDGVPGSEVELAFGPVRLPAGVNRLQVRLHLQLPAPAARPPAPAIG